MPAGINNYFVGDRNDDRPQCRDLDEVSHDGIEQMLSIGPNEHRALLEAVERARAKPVMIDQVMAGAQYTNQSTNTIMLAERDGKPPFRIAVQQVELPVGYRVAISFEQQPAGLCLHLSMSSSASGKVPHPEAIAMVLDAIGITRSSVVRSWIEEFEIDGNSGGLAANVVVLMVPAQGGKL
jgi:hypothetical protein